MKISLLVTVFVAVVAASPALQQRDHKDKHHNGHKTTKHVTVPPSTTTTATTTTTTTTKAPAVCDTGSESCLGAPDGCLCSLGQCSASVCTPIVAQAAIKQRDANKKHHKSSTTKKTTTSCTTKTTSTTAPVTTTTTTTATTTQTLPTACDSATNPGPSHLECGGDAGCDTDPPSCSVELTEAACLAKCIATDFCLTYVYSPRNLGGDCYIFLTCCNQKLRA